MLCVGRSQWLPFHIAPYAAEDGHGALKAGRCLYVQFSSLVFFLLLRVTGLLQGNGNICHMVRFTGVVSFMD